MPRPGQRRLHTADNDDAQRYYVIVASTTWNAVPTPSRTSQLLCPCPLQHWSVSATLTITDHSMTTLINQSSQYTLVSQSHC